MAYAPSITTRTNSYVRPLQARRSRLASILLAILAALHHSRRLQAQQTLNRYRHLFDRANRRADATIARAEDQHVAQ